MKFDSFHPFINLMYFFGAMAAAIAFNHPFFVGAAYICFFAYSVKLNGKKALIFNLCLIPFILIHTMWYAYYNHFGVTPLAQNFTGNYITAEAIAYGFTISFQGATVVMIMSCLVALFSTDKVIYLLGRISPKISLFCSILLRTVPRVKNYAKRINTARQGVGRSAGQGGVLARMKNGLALVSTLITWTMENFVESSASMKARGYSLKGRTAFSIYRFDNRDRLLVIALFFLMTVMAVGWAANQTNIYFNPQIIFSPVIGISFIFYVAYPVMLLLPMTIDIVYELSFPHVCIEEEKI